MVGAITQSKSQMPAKGQLCKQVFLKASIQACYVKFFSHIIPSLKGHSTQRQKGMCEEHHLTTH